MKTYLITAAGVIFISVVVSLIIPEGRLHKTVTFVMRMICILVLIQPISGIFKISDGSAGEVEADFAFVCQAYSENQSEALKRAINDKFSSECDCDVEIEYSDGKFKVSGVTVGVYGGDKKLLDEIYEYLEGAGYINISVYAKSA